MTLQEARSSQSGEDGRRHSGRYVMLLPIRLQRGGEPWAEACVLDLSAEGGLVAADALPDAGETIRLQFGSDEVEERTARVVWLGDGIFGCQFDARLEEDALALLKQRGRPLPRSSLSKAGGEAPIPALIAEAKRSLGISATSLARALHVSRPTLWAWEVGRSHPTGDNLVRLMDFLDREGIGDEAPRGPAPDDRGPGLDALERMLAQEKRRIAETLGVCESRIRITVEF